jgi:hypothetical protein
MITVLAVGWSRCIESGISSEGKLGVARKRCIFSNHGGGDDSDVIPNASRSAVLKGPPV